MNVWKRIDKRGPDECWPWQAALNAYGYGVLRMEGKVVMATRAVWRETHGPIPDGMCLCHTCDNRACCNPAHLWLGTRGDNLRDMCAKGRHGRGNLKLSDDAVRSLLADNESSGVALAARYGVSPSLVSMIRRGKHRRASL